MPTCSKGCARPAGRSHEPDPASRRAQPASIALKRTASYPGVEIIAQLATVLEVEAVGFARDR
jgi:hypothetical protein